MSNTQGALAEQSAPPSARARRDEHIRALLTSIGDPVHVRILDAYRVSGTVETAEAELARVLEEILDAA